MSLQKATSLQAAIDYANRGWAVLPVLPRSKVPAIKEWTSLAARNENDVRSLWQARTNFNVGLATGPQPHGSGFWVLDIDPDKGGAENLAALEHQHGKLPATLTSITGSGGKHYLFALPDGIDIRNSTSRIAPGIDVRGMGGQIVVCPSIHPNGAAYRWADEAMPIANAPAWLYGLAMRQVAPISAPDPAYRAEIVSYANQEDWSADDVQDMLDCLDADMSHDDWVAVGMALHDGGWPVGMWDNWSRGGTKYKSGECTKRWASFHKGGGKSFGTLVYMAQGWGWKPTAREVAALDFSNIGGIDFREFRASLGRPKAVAPPLEPIAAPQVSGLIADTLTWINSTALKVQPELSTMNILAALGAVFGRRYALQKLNTRTNIYFVGIAESGQGKDNSRQCVKKLMESAGLQNFSGPDEVRSGPGLLLDMKAKPSMLTNIDEMGMFMRGLFDAKAPGYAREISALFTKLYSSSGSTYIGGLIASKPTERNVLHEPNLCIYGTTTLASYAEAMRKSAVASGELNRFIVLKSSDDFPPPNFEADASDPPEHLVSRWAAFKPDGLAANAPANGDGCVVPGKTVVMLGDMAKAVEELFLFQDEMIKKYHSAGLGALWVRYRENILKIAMIFAIARDCRNPVINENDIENGKSLVTASINFMMKFASEKMYDSDFQKSCGDFMQALRENGGTMSRSKMNYQLRIKPKDLDAIEVALQEMGSMEVGREGKSKVYKLP